MEFLADLVILAKHAAQVAPGVEYRPRAAGAGNRRLLTKMQPRMRKIDFAWYAAIAHFAFEAIDPAISRAALTIGKLINE